MCSDTISRFLHRLFSPGTADKPFSAWQIELTTRCPLKCRMCIRDGLTGWQNRDMEVEDFKKILPFLINTGAVILEGWGESLLHPDLFEIIRLARSEGPQVGFVTSGKGLNRDYISEIINAGADFIGFSVSGGSSSTHESIRVNSDFDDLLENIMAFNEIKAERKLKNPKLHIVYLMLRDNISEVPSVIQTAAYIGIEDVVLINPTLITNEWQEGQRVFRCHPEHREGSQKRDSSALPQNDIFKQYEEILKEAEAKAGELKIRLVIPHISPVEVSVCSENPLRNLYISVDGEVSPCVYLYPPVTPPFRKIFCGNEYKTDRVSFGNIFIEPFYEIWNSRGYAEFRDCFIRRQKSVSSALFLGSIKGQKQHGSEYAHKPPDVCSTCHRMLGF